MGWQVIIASAGLAAIFSATDGTAKEADEFPPPYYDHYFAPKFGALPPLLGAGSGFQSSTTRPVERRTQVRLFERTFRFKTAYQERKLWSNSLVDGGRKNSIYSVHAASDIWAGRLSGEAEIAYNAFDRDAAEQMGRETARLFRLALKGEWLGYRYGAEYRSVDQGFMHFIGGPAWRGEGQARIWSEKNFGPLRIRLGLSQLRENLNESQAMPRLTRSSTLLLSHNKGKWQTAMSSAYSRRVDRFEGGSAVDVMSHELRLTWQPGGGIRVSPHSSYVSESNRVSRVGNMARSAGISFAFQSSRRGLNIISDTAYHWLRSSDRLLNSRDLRSVLKVIWNFDDIAPRRQSLSYEIFYGRHLDLVARMNSTVTWGARLSFTVVKF